MDFAPTDVDLPLLTYEESEDAWAFAQGIVTALGGEL